ncbi:hypothetical protein Tco_0348945 [Tanacetum coccineum]
MEILRALPTKWHPKVTAIEESKDLSTLPLDELIGNLKVYKVVLEKDSEISKVKKEKYKSLALKERKLSSDEEISCSESDDEEYAMAVIDFKKFFRRRGKFVRQPHDDKKNFRKIKEDKKEKKDRSDSKDDSKKEEICLMAIDNNDVLSDTPYYISSSLDSESLQNGGWGFSVIHELNPQTFVFGEDVDFRSLEALRNGSSSYAMEVYVRWLNNDEEDDEVVTNI